MKNKGFIALSNATKERYFVIDNGNYMEVSMRPESARRQGDDYEFYSISTKEFDREFRRA